MDHNGKGYSVLTRLPGVFRGAHGLHLCPVGFSEGQKKKRKKKRFIVISERAILQIPPAWISRVMAVMCLLTAFEG